MKRSGKDVADKDNYTLKERTLTKVTREFIWVTGTGTAAMLSPDAERKQLSNPCNEGGEFHLDKFNENTM